MSSTTIPFLRPRPDVRATHCSPSRPLVLRLGTWYGSDKTMREQLVQNALSLILAGGQRTAVFVAHRLSAIKMATAYS